MKLPNPDLLIVDQGKITDYLLNPAHRYGASKARFFSGCGFQREEWKALAGVLLKHGREHEVIRTIETGFGARYVVEGEIRGPDGTERQIRTVWQFDRGQIAPRLITAYPYRRIS
jgi:hypothetical protein